MKNQRTPEKEHMKEHNPVEDGKREERSEIMQNKYEHN